LARFSLWRLPISSVRLAIFSRSPEVFAIALFQSFVNCGAVGDRITVMRCCA